MARLLMGLVGVAVLATFAVADVGPPAHLQITERDGGVYLVQWRVPKVLPPRAVPRPRLPENCHASGERTVSDQPGAWLFTQEWQCESTIAGQAVGMRYPFPDLALTTVVRVDLESGDRFAHVLSPGEGSWTLPEGTAAPDLIGAARRAVGIGAAHATGSPVHLLFLVVVGLFGRVSLALRLVTAFTIGQIVGVAGSAVGFSLSAVPAELAFAVAGVLLAREALSPPEVRRRLVPLGVAAGLLHGLAVAGYAGGASAVIQLLVVLGMDALHLVGAGLIGVVAGLVASRASRTVRITAAYGAGAMGMALAFVLAVQGGAVEASTADRLQIPFATPTTNAGAGIAASRRIATNAPNVPVQSFLSVEPFEVRHEVMLRLGGLTDELDVTPELTLSIADQPRMLERLAEFVLSATTMRVDRSSVIGLVRRSDFMTVDPTGALPRENPVPESVGAAVAGIVVAYPTPGMPQEVSLHWDRFPLNIEVIPATVIDPEAVESITMSAARTVLRWENVLLEDPIPSVEAVEVDPLRAPVPLLSIPLALLVVILFAAGLRGWHPGSAVAAARVIAALALLVGPLAQVSVPIPGSLGRAPTERQARRILAGLLPNVYRALEFKTETAIFDRLAVSVTGETLTDVYLEQRRALEMEERGGAQARVEAVEVLEASEIESRPDGFFVRSAWTVGGMVTHFGHRHFRQNRYDARISVVPVEGTWKIRSIEVLEQERVQ